MDIKPSIPGVSVIGGGRSSLLAAALVAALAKPAPQAQVLQPGSAAQQEGKRK